MKKSILTLIIKSILLLSLTLAFSACGSDDDDDGLGTDTSEWIQPNAEDYEYTMTYITQISVENIINQSEETEIAVFSGEECRGKASLKYDQSLDIYLCYLTIFSNAVSGEKMSVRVFDGKGKFLFKNVLTIEFINNKSMGSADNILNCSK